MYDRVCTINDSSNVKAVRFEIATSTMRIDFTSGSYEYPNVSPAIFGGIVSSESVGKAVNKFTQSNNGVKL